MKNEKGNSLPLVSIIIPTYNRQGPVLRAIDSVLRQSFKAFELIVVDDGSTDNTATWVSLINDPRLVYKKTANKGVSAARNAGAALASSDWLCFLDSDDLWKKNKLSEQVTFHRERPSCLISQTDETWIKNSKRINKMTKHKTKEGNIFRESLRLCLISPSAVMIKKSLFVNCGCFDESLPVCEDYALWLNVLATNMAGLINKELVTKFGGHKDQLSKKLPIMDAYRIQALEKLLLSDFLSEEQQKWTEQELLYKKHIVEQGKKKRRS
ncbi:MAG: glycosyltransferase [bacterium]|nr:glycosyltransferase [bacterium]MBU1918552.1 glycosyltransferase [bacterium]